MGFCYDVLRMGGGGGVLYSLISLMSFDILIIDETTFQSKS